MNFLCEYWKCQNEERRCELSTAVLTNAGFAFVDKVCLFVPLSEDCQVPEHPKIVKIPVSHRATYHEHFNFASLAASSDGLSVVLNTDIHVEADFADKLKRYDFSTTCLALSRWDLVKGKLVQFMEGGSYDTYVFKTPFHVDCHFTSGIFGCDSILAWTMNKAGRRVINPSCSIRTVHLHESGARSYSDFRMGLPGGANYLTVPQTH
jgi:hypothetical protein